MSLFSETIVVTLFSSSSMSWLHLLVSKLTLNYYFCKFCIMYKIASDGLRDISKYTLDEYDTRSSHSSWHQCLQKFGATLLLQPAKHLGLEEEFTVLLLPGELTGESRQLRANVLLPGFPKLILSLN